MYVSYQHSGQLLAVAGILLALFSHLSAATSLQLQPADGGEIRGKEGGRLKGCKLRELLASYPTGGKVSSVGRCTSKKNRIIATNGVLLTYCCQFRWVGL